VAVKACVNGTRRRTEHPVVADLAANAVAV
jgi:hypothetical protein